LLQVRLLHDGTVRNWQNPSQNLIGCLCCWREGPLCTVSDGEAATQPMRLATGNVSNLTATVLRRLLPLPTPVLPPCQPTKPWAMLPPAAPPPCAGRFHLGIGPFGLRFAYDTPVLVTKY
jgi:hypothetical protein